MPVTVRPDEPSDFAAIFGVLEAAFPTAAEARLVDRLREAGHLPISLVAEDDGAIVGQIAFSPVRVDGADDHDGTGLGLAPLAVLPAHQRSGIGGRLVREGLACGRDGVGFVVVLGAPSYYRRFGFDRADRLGLGNEYGAVEEFMVVAVREGALPNRGGLVRFGPEFAEFGT